MISQCDRYHMVSYSQSGIWIVSRNDLKICTCQLHHYKPFFSHFYLLICFCMVLVWFKRNCYFIFVCSNDSRSIISVDISFGSFPVQIYIINFLIQRNFTIVPCWLMLSMRWGGLVMTFPSSRQLLAGTEVIFYQNFCKICGIRYSLLTIIYV